jgi:hypothetical protein
MTPDPIAMFEAGVTRVKTMADGSPRFEFEAGEPAISVMQALAEAQASRKYLMIIVYDLEDWKRLEADNKGK